MIEPKVLFPKLAAQGVEVDWEPRLVFRFNGDLTESQKSYLAEHEDDILAAITLPHYPPARPGVCAVCGGEQYRVVAAFTGQRSAVGLCRPCWERDVLGTAQAELFRRAA